MAVGFGLKGEELYRDDDAAAEIQRIAMGDMFRRQPPTGKAMIRQREGLAVTGSRPDSAGLASLRELARSGDTEAYGLSYAEERAAGIDGDLVEQAQRDLAGLLGVDVSEVSSTVLALTAEDPSYEAQAEVLGDIAKLSKGEFLRLAAEADYWTSKAGRDHAVSKGWALKDGSYPIPNAHYLRSAAKLASTGHGNVTEARKLIMKRASELGIDVHSLPGFSEEEHRSRKGNDSRRPRRGQDGLNGPRHGISGSESFGSGQDSAGGPDGGGGTAMTADGYQWTTVGGARYLRAKSNDGSPVLVKLAYAEPEPESDVDYYVAMAAEEAHTPGAFGSTVGKAPFDVHDVGSSGDGESDTRSQEQIARILKDHGGTGLFCGGGAAYGSSTSYKPKSAAARRRDEERELAGGRPQSYRR